VPGARSERHRLCRYRREAGTSWRRSRSGAAAFASDALVFECAASGRDEAFPIEYCRDLAIHLALSFQFNNPLPQPINVDVIAVGENPPLHVLFAGCAGLPDDLEAHPTSVTLLIRNDFTDDKSQNALCDRLSTWWPASVPSQSRPASTGMLLPGSPRHVRKARLCIRSSRASASFSTVPSALIARALELMQAPSPLRHAAGRCVWTGPARDGSRPEAKFQHPGGPIVKYRFAPRSIRRMY